MSIDRAAHERAWHAAAEMAARLETAFPEGLAALTPILARSAWWLDRWLTAIEHFVRNLLIALAATLDPPAQARRRPRRARTDTPAEAAPTDPDDPARWRASLRILARPLRHPADTSPRRPPSEAARAARRARLRTQRERQRRLRDLNDRHAAFTGELLPQRETPAERARFEAYCRDLENDFADHRDPGACTFEDMNNAPFTDEDERVYRELCELEGVPYNGPLAQAANPAPTDAATSAFRPAPGACSARLARFHAEPPVTLAELLRPDPASSSVSPRPFAIRLEALNRILADPMGRARRLARTLARRAARAAIRIFEPDLVRRQDPILRGEMEDEAAAWAAAALARWPPPPDDSS